MFGRVAQQVDQVDVGELVLDRPDLNRRMVSFALDLRDALVAPVLHQRQLDLRSALLLAGHRDRFSLKLLPIASPSSVVLRRTTTPLRSQNSSACCGSSPSQRESRLAWPAVLMRVVRWFVRR